MGWEQELVEVAPDREVAVRVAWAVARLLRDDAYLFEVDANERSISHRLGLYLQEGFPEWDVDCEFNRDGHDAKRLFLTPEEVRSDDEEGTTVYPDIVLHERGASGRNLLAIEIKKDAGNPDVDRRKLHALRDQLGYRIGLFLRFRTGTLPGVAEVSWFPHGQWGLNRP